MNKYNNSLVSKFDYPITCLATYSASVAKNIDGIVDVVLIGDSVGTTLYGMDNTQGVTLEMMKNHGLAVTKNIKKSITVIDMPYKSYENKKDAFKNAKDLIKYTKANYIKIEIDKKKLKILKYLSSKNINVIAHLGVTPQKFKNFKDIKILGKSKAEEDGLIKLSSDAEKMGAKALLLECITQQTSKKITSLVTIPTIGIGASKYCDGQILVFDDLINLSLQKIKPKFLKTYMNFNKVLTKAVKQYVKDVKQKKFPSSKYSY